MRNYDVAIVGGGPAGLAAALTLARSRRRAVVLDSGSARNRASPGVMGYLARNGTPPAVLLRAARAEIGAYGFTDFIDQPVRSIDQLDDKFGFRIETSMSSGIAAKYVVLATGVIDVLPDIAGLSDLWGRNVIHCEFCHGWENSDRRWGVCVNHASDFAWVAGMSNWTGELVLFVAAELCLSSSIKQMCNDSRIEIVGGRIKSLAADATGQLVAVRLENGSTIPCGTLLLRPAQEQAHIVQSMGVGRTHDGRVVVDDFYATTVDGVYAAGDIIPGPQTVANAAAGGAAIGRSIAYRLATDTQPGWSWRRALSA